MVDGCGYRHVCPGLLLLILAQNLQFVQIVIVNSADSRRAFNCSGIELTKVASNLRGQAFPPTSRTDHQEQTKEQKFICLKSLKAVELKGSRRTRLPIWELPPFLELAPDVDTLVFRGVYLVPGGRQDIGCLPFIKKLHFEDSAIFKPPFLLTAKEKPRFPGLQHLTMGAMTGVANYLQYLLARELMDLNNPPVKSLTLKDESLGRDIFHLATFPNLNTLSIPFGSISTNSRGVDRTPVFPSSVRSLRITRCGGAAATEKLKDFLRAVRGGQYPNLLHIKTDDESFRMENGVAVHWRGANGGN
jgi:hypothetical protein